MDQPFYKIFLLSRIRVKVTYREQKYIYAYILVFIDLGAIPSGTLGSALRSHLWWWSGDHIECWGSNPVSVSSVVSF